MTVRGGRRKLAARVFGVAAREIGQVSEGVRTGKQVEITGVILSRLPAPKTHLQRSRSGYGFAALT